MNIPAPTRMRCGDYARSYGFTEKHPDETDAQFSARTEAWHESTRASARDTMKRQGCKSIRFELLETGQLVAHGYVGRMSGPNVEEL